MKQAEPPKVFITARESVCDECGEELGHKAWITLAGDRGSLCLACADLDHLVFLPAGDTAVTRRARKHSTLVAVVLKWSPARKRYERQGLLVEDQALERAEQECLADAEVRMRRRERQAEYRAQLDQQYVARFAARVRELYPECPAGREMIIAEHACRKYSGRVGRTASAKSLADEAVDLAVIAHIRHTETKYDQLLRRYWDRRDARASIAEEVRHIRAKWGRSE